MHRSHVTTSIALLSALLFAGCSGKSAQVAEEAPAPAVTEVVSEPAVEPVSVEKVIQENTKDEPVAVAPQPEPAPIPPDAGDLQIVFFEYDSSDLTAEARRVLTHHAEWMRENQEVKAMIEGHCDERGSDEYNLALGEKRATVTREYLVAMGVSPERLGTVSYGEGRPVRGGHDETAWEKNRRVEFR